MREVLGNPSSSALLAGGFVSYGLHAWAEAWDVHWAHSLLAPVHALCCLGAVQLQLGMGFPSEEAQRYTNWLSIGLRLLTVILTV